MRVEPLISSRLPNRLLATRRSRTGCDERVIPIIAALISVVIIVAITAVGTQLTTTFNSVSTALSGANN
jgi:hypothetical protein